MSIYIDTIEQVNALGKQYHIVMSYLYVWWVGRWGGGVWIWYCESCTFTHDTLNNVYLTMKEVKH